MMSEIAERRTDAARDATAQGLRKILVATDFSPASERARDYAIAIAEPNASLTVLHVHLMPLPSWPKREAPEWMRDEPSMREEALDRLNQFGSRATAAGLTTRSMLQEGLPAEVILSQAAALQPDLIAMGTHGRSGVERLVLGSIAERVVRLAAAPVLTVSPAGVGTPSRIRRVLCTVGAESGFQTLAFAGDLARRCGAALTVMHVLEEAHDRASGRWRDRRAGERLREAVATAGVRHAELLVRAGQPPDEILRAAVELMVDVIVMGARGRPSRGRRCLGGTADAVVRGARCGVIRLPVPAATEPAEIPGRQVTSS